MTSLEDKAEGSPDVDLARQSAPGAYRLSSKELAGADELTAEGEFPKFGDFLKVERLGYGDGDEPEAKGEKYIECPAGLAEWLVENEISVGDDFRVLQTQKVDGEWQYDCEVI